MFDASRLQPRLKESLGKMKSLLPSQVNELTGKWFGVRKVVESGPIVRLSCDLGRSKIIFLEATKTGDQMMVTQLQHLDRPTDSEGLSQLLKKMATQGGFQTNKLRISIKGQGIVLRFIQFPQMNDEEIRSAITFEAEKYIPFKADEVILDYQILDREVASGSGKMMNLLLVAVKKTEVYPLITLYQEAGFQIELIDSDVLSFMNFIEFVYPDAMSAPTAVLDIGHEISSLGILRAGKPQFIRDISYGGADLLKKIRRKLGLAPNDPIDAFQSTEPMTPEFEQIIVESMAPLVSDIKVSLDYYSDQVQPSEVVQKMYLTGTFGNKEIAKQQLSKSLGFDVIKPSFREKVKFVEAIPAANIEQGELFMPVALGLCVREL